SASGVRRSRRACSWPMRPAPIRPTRTFWTGAVFLDLNACNTELSGMSYLQESFFIQQKRFTGFEGQDRGVSFFHGIQCARTGHRDVKAKVLLRPRHFDDDAAGA